MENLNAKKFEVRVGKQTFLFSQESSLPHQSNKYDLEIIEPDYDRKTEEILYHGTSEPLYIDGIKRKMTYLEPCTRIYKDKNGNKRLDAYFD